MNIEEFTEYCLSKNGVLESFPFGDDTLVFKVANKIFALCGIDSVPFCVNLKCDPEYAVQLREEFSEITPGYHMNKKHWNTVNFEGELDHKLLTSLIDHSYTLILKSLPKKVQNEFL
jgi:predicted DNA-binding protein (MmcQ/YjbR family)